MNTVALLSILLPVSCFSPEYSNPFDPYEDPGKLLYLLCCRTNSSSAQRQRIYLQDFSVEALDTSKWTLSGTPAVSSGKLVLNQNDHLRFSQILGIDMPLTVEVSISNPNGNPAAFRTSSVLLKEITANAFGCPNAANECFAQYTDQGQVEEFLASSSDLDTTFRQGTEKVSFFWNSSTIGVYRNGTISKSNAISSIFGYSTGSGYGGSQPMLSSGFMLEFYTFGAAQDPTYIDYIGIYSP